MAVSGACRDGDMLSLCARTVQLTVLYCWCISTLDMQAKARAVLSFTTPAGGTLHWTSCTTLKV